MDRDDPAGRKVRLSKPFDVREGENEGSLPFGTVERVG